jgi:hypothetical protein
MVLHSHDCEEPESGSHCVVFCSQVCGYQRFGGTSCLHLQGYGEWGESAARLYMQGDIKVRYSANGMGGERGEGPT